MTDIELINEMTKRADEFIEKQKIEFAIEELEKLIGAMLQNMQIINGEFGDELTNEQESYNDGLRKGIELLREKLSELKGEIK